jgi:hypothetical protein
MASPARKSMSGVTRWPNQLGGEVVVSAVRSRGGDKFSFVNDPRVLVAGSDLLSAPSISDGHVVCEV